MILVIQKLQQFSNNYYRPIRLNRYYLLSRNLLSTDSSSGSGSNGNRSNNSSKQDEANRKRPGTGLIRRKNGINFRSDAKVYASGDDGSDVVDLSNQISDLARVRVPEPTESLILPTNGRPIFPGFRQTMITNNERLFKTLSSTQSSNSYVSVFFTHRTDDEIDDLSTTFDFSDICRIGTFCQVLGVYPIYAPTQPSAESRTGNRRFSAAREERTNDSDEAVRKPTGYRLELEAHRRVELNSLKENTIPMFGKIEHLSDSNEAANEENMKAHMQEVLDSLKHIMIKSAFYAEQIQLAFARFSPRNAGALADFAAAMSQGKPEELQDILQEIQVDARLEKVLYLLKKDLKMFELQEQISKQVDKKVNETQRRHYLRQQLKEIQEELGYNKDDKRVLIENFEKKLGELVDIGEKDSVPFPENAMKTIEEELVKLSSLDQDSSEFNYSRRYLEWLLNVPWTVFSKDNYDLLKAHEVLERDHYGLEDIKERIMEYIAVGNLKGEIKGKILLLVGPPGVGKTSIGNSIASALGREFFRFSVGGLSDVSEIKGHRRTYVGAMPGKIIQCLKQTKTMNPLILIDEIDKLSTGYRGDPASALLELLDPSQNTSFVDHYLDVPVDVSKVLFVCTANMTDTIPAPLLDRMEVLRLSGYDLPEKINIARDYLVPRAKKEAGLMNDNTEDVDHRKHIDVQISNLALEHLARWYCREAGVRKLQQVIERIYRKVAFLVVKNESTQEIPNFSTTRKEKKELVLPKVDTYEVCEDDIEALVGKPVYQKDRMYEDTVPVGVVMGLAWTSVGGTSLYIETTSLKKASQTSQQGDSNAQPMSQKSGGLVVTGQLGDVMKESSTIALTNAKHILQNAEPNNTFFDENIVHLHVPEGATPKDGPSAGVTMTTALLSLALNKQVSSDIAMTGEISLTGMVLPVGGIKEKVIAARRAGISMVILPDGNRKDVDELPDYLKENLSITFAKTYDDVFKIAFAY